MLAYLTIKDGKTNKDENCEIALNQGYLPILLS